MNIERESPYQGLTPYDEGDAPYFFGREKETKLIVASLFASSLTLLYGASGVGKSSVLRAGVVNSLRKRNDVLVFVFNQWQGDALLALKLAIANEASGYIDQGKVPATPMSNLVNTIETWARKQRRKQTSQSNDVRLDEFLVAVSRLTGDRRLLIILDQFEEYSLYHPTDDSFAEQWPGAVGIRDLSASFLVSLREDALATLDRFEGRLPNLFDNYRRMDHLTKESAKQAILLPVKEYNRRNRPDSTPVTVEPELVDEVLKQVRTGQVQLGQTGRGTVEAHKNDRIETPYLQLVMTRLWSEEIDQNSDVLKLSTLNRLGGAEHIVQTHLNTVMDRLSLPEQEIAARIFDRLVTPSGTKIALMAQDLAPFAGVSQAELVKILTKLSSGSDRILRPVAAPVEFPDEPRYEIFHDRLAPAILDWCSRFVEKRKTEESQRIEAERHQAVAAQIDGAMERLSSDEQDLFTYVLSYLGTPSGTKNSVIARDVAKSLDVLPEDVWGVLLKLSKGDYPLIRMFETTTSGDPQFEIVHDALVLPLFDWRARHLRAKELEQTNREAVIAERPAEHRGRHVSPEDPVFGSLIDGFRNGKVVPILGPGLAWTMRSKDSLQRSWKDGADFLPTSAELANYLAALCNFPSTDSREASNLMAVASYFEYVDGVQRLQKTLARVFGRKFPPSPMHTALASIAVSTPITVMSMSYDNCLEAAFDEAGVPYDLVSNLRVQRYSPRRVLWWRSHGAETAKLESPHNLDIDRHKTSIIFRFFGSIFQPTVESSGLLISEFDWFNLLVRGVMDELPNVVRRALLGHKLFMGLGSPDWPTRCLIYGLREDNMAGAGPASVISRSPSPLDQVFWKAVQAKVFDIDLNELAERLTRESPA